jgi:hypothetical protein
LPQIADTGNCSCSFSGTVQCREQHTCKNCNDGNYYQQFNQSETTSDSMYYRKL